MDLSPELIELMRNEEYERRPDDSNETRKDKQRELLQKNPIGTKYYKILEDSIINNNIYPWDNGWLIPKVKKSSKKLLYKEFCITFPKKDVTEKNKFFEDLIKYADPIEYEAHFEIGKKSGIYHYHGLIGTHKYLKKDEIKRISRGNRFTWAKVRDFGAYKTYMIKESHLPVPEGW